MLYWDEPIGGSLKY